MLNEEIAGIAKNVLDGRDVTREEAVFLSHVDSDAIYDLLYCSNKIRRKFLGDRLSLCSIINAKSGNCSEDCRFCSQSSHHKTGIAAFPFVGREKIIESAKKAKHINAHAIGIVTSGNGVFNGVCNGKDFEAIVDTVKEIKEKLDFDSCCSLGQLTEESALRLKSAGLEWYNHNLETSKRHFGNICTTHTYKNRVSTVEIAKKAGLKVCCGGIFGVGENFLDRIDLAFELKQLCVDSIPLNFLNPIKGTPLQDADPLSPMEALKIIALFRFINPKTDIKVSGGREVNLRDLQSWIIYAGANGFITGGYLTTHGRGVEQDFQMIKDLNLKI